MGDAAHDAIRPERIAAPSSSDWSRGISKPGQYVVRTSPPRANSARRFGAALSTAESSSGNAYACPHSPQHSATATEDGMIPAISESGIG